MILIIDLITNVSTLSPNPNQVRQYLCPLNIAVWYGYSGLFMCFCIIQKNMSNKLLKHKIFKLCTEISTFDTNISTFSTSQEALFIPAPWSESNAWMA